MARENTTILYGWVARPPEEILVNAAEGIAECRMRVLTLRRTFVNDEMLLRGKEREDEIPVITRNCSMMDQMIADLAPEDGCGPDEPEYRGRFVFLKGTVCTRFYTISPICPSCGDACEHDRSVTYIDPAGIIVCNFGRSAAYAEALEVLRQHMEAGSKSVLYGSVCREPEYYEEGATELRFPLRSVRKRHIFEDPIDKKCDYPWVRSFGEHNRAYAANITKGSGVYIDGAVQSRDFDGQMIECSCGCVFPISGRASEVIPYAVKYQHGCGPDEEEDGELARMHPDENTVYLYGWMMAPPKFAGVSDDGRAEAVGIYIRAMRKAYDTEDPMRRGETHSDRIFVRTENRNLIQYITKELTPEQPKGPEDYYGYMVLVKGTLYMGNSRGRAVCDECGKEFEYSWKSARIDPIGIWKEDGPFFAYDATHKLRQAIEMSNVVFCHGTLTEDPLLYGDPRPECRFSIATTRIRRIWEDEDDEEDTPQVVVSGKKAVECLDALHEGSVIFIDGALRTVSYPDSLYACKCCGHPTMLSERVTEIIPYQIEYHTDCIIPESVRDEEDTE